MSCSGTRDGGGCGGVANGALHDDDVEPAVELPADSGERSDVHEADSCVQADGSLVCGVTDSRQHLSDAQRLASGDERGEEDLTDACSCTGQARQAGF
jgi:hypothetical protein